MKLRQSILREMHSSSYAMHLVGNKLYRDLRELYWWPGLKHEVTDFVSYYLTCQKLKAEHQLPSRLLQPVKIPLWKWERVTMYFVSGLPLTLTKKDSIWVIVDCFTKLLTSFQLGLITPYRSWRSFMSLGLLGFMGFQYRLF